MSKVCGFSDRDICFRGSIYSNPKESDVFFPVGSFVDVYFPPRKRSRISAPFVVSAERLEQNKQPSIEVLPDECLFEIFRRLPGSHERSASACVSKRWLMLMSCIRRDELCNKRSTQTVEPEEESAASIDNDLPKCEKKEDGKTDNGITELESDVLDAAVGDGFLSRSLDGKRATDVRLAAMAVGAASRGGLGKLSIRGDINGTKMTDFGMKAVGRGCPSLRVLTLWNVSSVTDEGLIEIANGCPLLEKLDLCNCPAITDKGIMSIAKNCPKLASLTLESCPKVGNEGLQAIGRFYTDLKSIAIKNCPLVGDQGIASLFSSAGHVLTNVKLQTLNITDISLAVVGHYGAAVTALVLTGLQQVNERGFWVMGNGQGLKNLQSIAVTACRGVTDVGIEAFAKGCPSLRQFSLRKSPLFSDNGLVSFARAAGSLENVQLEDCPMITQSGIFGLLVNSCGKLKVLSLANCLGIKDMVFQCQMLSICESMRSLSIRNCPGFGDASLLMLAKLCPKLTHLDLGGLCGISDRGILPLVQGNNAGLVKVNLGGCINLTDVAVSYISRIHGQTIELLNLDGCRYVTDASLIEIAENCSILCELDVSNCGITDVGVQALTVAEHLSLHILSISGCCMVTDNSVSCLEKLGETLVGLNIQRCSGISSAGVDVLVDNLWRCDILS